MKKLTRKELIEWVSNRECRRPKITHGEKYEVAWGEKRIDYKETPCGTCFPCRARIERKIKLKVREYTR